MNRPIDRSSKQSADTSLSDAELDRELQDYLQGDSEHSHRYRAEQADDVPESLDRKILAEARSALTRSDLTHSAMRGATSSRRRQLIWWTRAAVPVALAATVVLAVLIVPRDEQPSNTMQESEPVRSDELSNAAASRPAHAPEPAPQLRQTDALKKEAKVDLRPARQAAEGRALAAKPASPPPRAVGNIAVPSAADQSSAPAQKSTTPNSLALEEAIVTARKAEPIPEQAPHTDPAKWLEYIRHLRREGENDKADTEWAEFVKAFPHYHVADDDAARPATK